MQWVRDGPSSPQVFLFFNKVYVLHLSRWKLRHWMTWPRSYRKFGMENQAYDCCWFPSQHSNHWASFLISSLFWHCYQLSGPIPQPRCASPSLLLHINPTSQGNISKQSIGTQQFPQPVSLLHFMTCPPTNLFLAWSISLNYFYSKVSVSTLLSLRMNIFDPPISRLDGWQNPNSSSKNIHVLEVYSKPELGFGSQCGYFDLSSDLDAVSCDISVSSTESRVPICVRAPRHDGRSVHPVWETAPMDPLKFHSGCACVQWGFLIPVVLLLTWRHREFGPLTEAEVKGSHCCEAFSLRSPSCLFSLQLLPPS